MSVRAVRLRRVASPELSPEEVTEELQHRRREAAEKSAADPVDEPAAAPSAPVQKPDKGSTFGLDKLQPASSGAGFVLGLVAWAVAINYMQGGLPQVKRLAAAKFLNKTGG